MLIHEKAGYWGRCLILCQVSEEYKLVPDALYLAIHFIDLFLSQNYVERPKLQLLGITCILIAS